MTGCSTVPRVLIVDADSNVRAALKLLCQQALHLHVLAAVDSLNTALLLVVAAAPTIILLDWRLLAEPPGPAAWIERLRDGRRREIVVLGTESAARAEALAAGADTFVFKGDPPDHLLAALTADR